MSHTHRLQKERLVIETHTQHLAVGVAAHNLSIRVGNASRGPVVTPNVDRASTQRPAVSVGGCSKSVGINLAQVALNARVALLEFTKRVLEKPDYVIKCLVFEAIFVSIRKCFRHAEIR